MVDKAFFGSNGGNRLRILLDSLFTVADNAHALEKVVDTERTEETTRAVSRQHVVRAREVVTHWLAGPRADKHGTCVFNLSGHRFGFGGHHFQVFRSNAVRDFNTVEPVLHHQNAAEVAEHLFEEFSLRGIFDLHIDAGRNHLGGFHIVGNANGSFETGTVFGLAQKVGSNKVRIAGVVRHHEHFGGTCHHVDIDNAEDFFLGDSGKHVTRANNLVDAFHNRLALDILGTVCKQPDSLSATDVVDFFNAEFLQHECHSTVDFALDRGHHHDILNARHQSRNGVHNHGTRVNARTTRHIEAHTLHGANALTEDYSIGPFHKPGFFHLVLVEITHVLDGLLQGLLEFLGALGGRLCNGGCRHADVLALKAIELLGVFSRLGDATLLNIGKDLHYLVVNFLARGDFAPADAFDFSRLRIYFCNNHNNSLYYVILSEEPKVRSRRIQFFLKIDPSTRYTRS